MNKYNFVIPNKCPIIDELRSARDHVPLDMSKIIHPELETLSVRTIIHNIYKNLPVNQPIHILMGRF